MNSQFLVDIPYVEWDPVLDREIAFRAVNPAFDLDLIHGWMCQPHVIPFWQLDFSRKKFEQHLMRMLEDSHQSLYLGLLDGEPISYWEIYWACDDLIGRHYRADSFDQGVHLLIGPPEKTGRGLARPLLLNMMRFMFAESRTQRLVVEPDHRNAAMIHVFKRCGFLPDREVELPDAYPPKRALVMFCSRKDFNEIWTGRCL